MYVGPCAGQRIFSIDVLRGAALLGIALMNILFSGLPLAAHMNPTVSGGAVEAALIRDITKRFPSTGQTPLHR